MVVQLRGEVVVHEEQVAHLLGVGLRLVQPAQPRCVVFGQGDRHAGAVGHGQRHCGRVHGVEVQVRDPADGLLGVVVLLAQLGVVGLSEGLEDAAQPAHDGGPHVPVGLLVGDEVNGRLAGRVPQHGVPGGPGQRDVVDGVEPRLRPEGVPVALHHVRQGQDVGVAVVELAEGLPPHDVGGVHGQPVVLCAHRLPRQHAVVAVLLPHRGHLPRLGAAEVLEGHGQLAQDAVPRLLQVAVRPPLFERPSLRRRVRRSAQLQLGVKRGHQREELRQLLVGAGPEVVDHAGQACGEDVHAVHEPQRGPAHVQALLARLAEDSEAEVAVVALLDRGLQGAPAAEGPWRGLGLGLWCGLGHGPLGLACLALAALVVAVLAELFARRPADGRAHRGDVAQQEVEVVAAPVVKDHWDGLGRLGRDVAGVAQRPEILPGAVAVVELLLGGLEGREALPAVSAGPVLQLLPPGHADGPSSASPGEVVVNLRRSSSMARTAWYLSLSRSWCVSLNLSSSGGT